MSIREVLSDDMRSIVVLNDVNQLWKVPFLHAKSQQRRFYKCNLFGYCPEIYFNGYFLFDLSHLIDSLN